MTEKLKRYWLFILLILVLGIYLGAKAIPENGWDGWRVGSAQALLSIKHWSENGLVKNYLLFLPQGYSKTVKYFDDPELRQHTRGIATGGLIGKRLYYTHYPPGYLIPSALLIKLGIENRFWFRFLEILFSLAGLVFLYWFFNLTSENRIAPLLGVLYFGASTLFLDYADSLSSQPLEEFLRPAIIVLSILALKYGKKYFRYLIWIFYFVLSISSYDSTILIFAWLIGLDLMISKKVEWRRWLFWASAPILAFGLQLLQNVLYLGWRDMFLDLIGAVKIQILDSRKDFFISHLRRLFDPFGWFFGVKWYFGILISAIGIAILGFIKKHTVHHFNEKFLYLAFLAVLINFLLFPSLFFHQARAVSVFGGFLIGILTFFSAELLVQKEPRIKIKIISAVILIAVSGLWLIQANRTYAYLKQWPNNTWPIEKINFDNKIKNLIAGDKVIFQMFESGQETPGANRYPMIASEDEYYIGAPVLGFTNTDDLIRDFRYLKKQSEFPFSAVIIADKKETMDNIKKNLKTQNPISPIDDKFILIIN